MNNRQAVKLRRKGDRNSSRWKNKHGVKRQIGE